MNSVFDESKIRRQGAGSSRGGQFAAKGNSQPSQALRPVAERTDVMPQISAAEARRRLPVGSQITVTFLDGRLDSHVATVEGQSATLMSTRTSDGRRGRLEWRGTTALEDPETGSIVLSQEGIPFAAYTPEGADVPQPRTSWQAAESREARATSDPARLEALSTNGVLATARQVAQNANSTSTALLNAVTRHGEDRVLQDAVLHRAADERVIAVVAGSAREPRTLSLAARHPALPTDDLRRLSQHENPFVRLGAASNPSADAELLTLLAADHDGDVRMAVAGNENTPPKVLSSLSRGNGFVMTAVAANPNTPLEDLKRLSEDTSLGNQLPAMAAKNPSATPLMRQKAVGSTDPWIRQQVAKNPHLTHAEAVTLSHDADRHVRRALAENREILPESFGALTVDRDEFVRSTVAGNPAVSAEHLTRMSQDEFHAVRAGVAANPNTPVDVVRRLADDSAPVVKMQAQAQLRLRGM